MVFTLAYTAHFSYPLSLVEIGQRLVTVSALRQLAKQWQWLELLSALKSSRVTQSQNTDQLIQVVESLVAKKLLIAIKRNGVTWYSLATGSVTGDATMARRLRQARHSAFLASSTLRAESWQFVRWVRLIPWIQAVAITGSLAMNNAHPDDDTDFMLITAPGRLWLTRLVVTMIAVFFGKRRSWSHEEPRSWCFNLWLDQTALAVPASHQTVYGAYEALQAQWVVDRGAVEQRFWQQNQWVKLFLIGSPTILKPAPLPQAKNLQNWFGQGITKVGNFFESVAYQTQRWYMSRHMTREKVSPHAAFFHPRDTRSQLETAWRDSLLIWYKQAYGHST